MQGYPTRMKYSEKRRVVSQNILMSPYNGGNIRIPRYDEILGGNQYHGVTIIKCLQMTAMIIIRIIL